MTDMDYSDDTSTFGDRLCAARQAAGIKRKVLAEQIGVKASTLRNWEEDRSDPRANRLTIMSGILGVPLVWLMTGEGEGPAGEAGADEAAYARASDLGALAKDFAAARAELTAANRKLAGIERRLKRLALR